MKVLSIFILSFIIQSPLFAEEFHARLTGSNERPGRLWKVWRTDGKVDLTEIPRVNPYPALSQNLTSCGRPEQLFTTVKQHFAYDCDPNDRAYPIPDIIYTEWMIDSKLAVQRAELEKFFKEKSLHTMESGVKEFLKEDMKDKMKKLVGKIQSLESQIEELKRRLDERK